MAITTLDQRRVRFGSDRISARELRPVLALLKAVSHACASTASLEDATSACLEIIARFAGWPIAHAYRRRTVDGIMATMRTWFIAASVDRPSARAFISATEEIAFAPGAGLIGRAAAARRPITCPEIMEEPHFLRTAAARASGVRGCFMIPVVVEGRAEIVLEFFARERAELDDSMSDLLTFVAGCLADTIKHAHHMRVLDAALSHMTQGLLMLDTDLRMIVCNDSYRDLFGFTAEFARPGIPLSELIARTGARDRQSRQGGGETMAKRRAQFAQNAPFLIRFDVNDDGCARRAAPRCRVTSSAARPRPTISRPCWRTTGTRRAPAPRIERFDRSALNRIRGFTIEAPIRWAGPRSTPC